MPVAILLVEGELDEQVLLPLKPTDLTLERGGSKGALGLMARERRKKVTATCYLRDRDFDFDPPADLSAPTIDATYSAQGPSILGWRWCRHEIENYLLEPALVEEATGWDQASYIAALLGAARRILHYTSARWAVGITRRGLPPLRELPTRPSDLSNNDIKLPADCSEVFCDAWAHAQVAAFLHQVQPILQTEAVAAVLAERKQRLSALTGPAEVLLWYAGKDLLAALAPALPGTLKDHPKLFVRRLRDWIRNKPNAARLLFPEWDALLVALSA